MRTHRTDAVSLAFGVLFVGFAGLWLVSQVITLDLATAGWFAVGALILLGVAGIVGVSLGAARRRDANDEAAGPLTATGPGAPHDDAHRHADDLEH